jgi:lipid II:glycine glycyltransferase (peptidoglycan interpeptide bridge formation enzyme)
MLITERKYGIFKSVNVFFAELPGTADIPDCDLVTYHTYKNWGDIKGFERTNYLTTTIDLSQSIDVMWNKITRQHKRHIKRAVKNGTDITVSENYEWFYQVNKKCLKQKKLADPIGLNIRPSKFMQKYGTLFIAENHGEILGANLYFHDEKNALYVEGICKNIENNIENKKWSIDANCYLHWVAMKYFKNMHIINYDLGCVSCDDTKINHTMNGGEYFKRSFGGNVISRYTYVKFNSRFSKLLFHSWNHLFDSNQD